MELETWMWIAIAAGAAVVVLALIGWAMMSKRRSDRLKDRYGDEYDRVVMTDGRKNGESELIEREKKVQQLNIRPLTATEAQRFANLWNETQARFVDQPGGALADADQLVGDVMVARGYPVEDFEARAADVSVDHPSLVDHYRTAHDVAERHAVGNATTEEMRQAMIHYRALFSELLETEDLEHATAPPR